MEENDNILRIDVNKDMLTEMLKFKLYSDMLSSFCPEDDLNLKKNKSMSEGINRTRNIS